MCLLCVFDKFVFFGRGVPRVRVVLFVLFLCLFAMLCVFCFLVSLVCFV